MFSLLTLFAVVLIHVVMQMRRKDLAEAERKHNFLPRVVITALPSNSSAGECEKGRGGGGGEKGEMGWVDPTTHGQGAEESAAKQKQKEEEENEWAREDMFASWGCIFRKSTFCMIQRKG